MLTGSAENRSNDNQKLRCVRWGLDTEDDGVGRLIVDVGIWIFFGPGILHHLILCASVMMPLFNLERHDVCTADELPCVVENSISECQKQTVKGVSQYVRLFLLLCRSFLECGRGTGIISCNNTKYPQTPPSPNSF